MAKDRTNEAAEANEMQTTETATQDEVQAQTMNEFETRLENDSETIPEIKPEVKLPKLYVYRRRYTNKSDGKQYWEYVLPAVFCGQVAEVNFKCDDVIGYAMLERLFDCGAKKVELLATETKQYDDNTKVMRKYWTYSVVGKNEEGFEWSFPVKAKQTSDKAIADNYFRYLLFKAERETSTINK